MPTFTPPSQNAVPPVLPDWNSEQSPVARALGRHMHSRPEGINVYVLSDGTVTETDPDSVSVFWGAEDFGRTTEPYVFIAFWGATGPYEIDSDMATLLESEGYNVDA